MNNNFISIKSVLYDLSTLVPEDLWNSIYLEQWANIAARKIMPEIILQDNVILSELTEHTALMPKDFKYLNMIAIYNSSVDDLSLEDIKRILNLENTSDNTALYFMNNPEGLPKRVQEVYNNSSTKWEPLHKTSSPFLKSFNCITDFRVCDTCRLEYSLESNNSIVSNVKNGLILISYKSLPKSEDGSLLIPDDETFKEAILHFCMFRYYLSKSILGEVHSFREREWHLKRYSILAQKSKSLNLPDLNTLENIKNTHTRLITKTNRFNSFFSGLGSKEIIES